MDQVYFSPKKIDGNLNECSLGTQMIGWQGIVVLHRMLEVIPNLAVQYYIGYSDSLGVLIPHVPVSIADINDNDNFHQLYFSTSDEIIKANDKPAVEAKPIQELLWQNSM